MKTVLSALLILISLLFAGCKNDGDGRPFSGFTDAGFFLTTTTDLNKVGRDGNPDLKNLQTFDLNWAQPGGTPTTSEPFYLFGNVQGGSIEITKIEVKGRDAADFTVTGITLPAEISYLDYKTFSVQFSPTASGGDRDAYIAITSTRGTVQVLHVQANAQSGSGEISIWQGGMESFNMANLPAGTMYAMASSPSMMNGGCDKPYDGTVALEIKNLGDGPLEVDSGDIIRDDQNAFDWETSGMFPLTIAANSSAIVKLQVKDSLPDGQSYFAAATFHSDDTNEPIYTVGFTTYKQAPKACLVALPHLEGTSVTLPTLPYFPSGQPIHTPDVGPEVKMDLTLWNAGTAPLTLDESTFSFMNQMPAGGFQCQQNPSFTVDLDTTGSTLTIPPGATHLAKIVLKGYSLCQNVPPAIPFVVFLHANLPNADGGGGPGIATLEGIFNPTLGPTAITVKTAAGATVANGGTLQMSGATMTLTLTKASNAPLGLMFAGASSSDYQVTTDQHTPYSWPDGVTVHVTIRKLVTGSPYSTHLIIDTMNPQTNLHSRFDATLQ